ncbi:hypothetical protein DI491_05530 [Streptococcus pyogenes]|nr:hypothetical protein A4265_01070 [Streptococcus pyogenes]AWS22618.1 hypothetical protein C5P47_01205 [Streptococcus pyogenes]OAF76913.1 hypothetical protein AXK21_01140 [Streptococcus pyogenes]PWU76039.1 hypothetical protein DJ559_03275 [Streptococcus pyogenes]PWV35245.1 hypothetical protein DI491_05530 [Streptococcus pyogenes]
MLLLLLHISLRNLWHEKQATNDDLSLPRPFQTSSKIFLIIAYFTCLGEKNQPPKADFMLF